MNYHNINLSIATFLTTSKLNLFAYIAYVKVCEFEIQCEFVSIMRHTLVGVIDMNTVCLGKGYQIDLFGDRCCGSRNYLWLSRSTTLPGLKM